MCDAFLVLAQAPGGLSCFLVPRWRPDGTKNPLQIIRLKRKMGNVSNASSETELRGALGWMVGPEGRGVPTIIEMVAMTRFDCMIGSSAGMRMAVSQAIDHCRQRKAFGALLIDQPIMTAVLADLAIEAEAALTLTMRVARALDHRDDSARGRAGQDRRRDRQILDLQARAGPCLRGAGMPRRLRASMEDSPMPRLYREAPVNAIWEGSGNVQCLDIAARDPAFAADARSLFRRSRSGEGRKRNARPRGRRRSRTTCATSPISRPAPAISATGWRSCLQAAALIRAGSPIADAFCRSRLETRGAHNYGALTGVDAKAIVKRAAPR